MKVHHARLTQRELSLVFLRNIRKRRVSQFVRISLSMKETARTHVTLRKRDYLNFVEPSVMICCIVLMFDRLIMDRERKAEILEWV